MEIINNEQYDEEENNVEDYSKENYNNFLLSDLQLKGQIIKPVSEKFSDVFIQDLVLTNFNEVDINFSRSVICAISDFKMFNLDVVANEILKPKLFSIVNTARSRNGFERKALITRRTDENARITGNMKTSLWEKLRGRNK